MLTFRVPKHTEEELACITRIAKHTGLTRQAAGLLYNRGIHETEQADAFLQGNVFHDPFFLEHMEQAVDCIEQALAEKKHITVYGDYDCDGVCSCAVLAPMLAQAGAEVNIVIPDRKQDGYGLNAEAVKRIAQTSDLLITVDCGITNLNEAALAKQLGLQLIITDHHEPLEELPDAIVINPHISPDYPFHMLCGAGVAFKLCHALFGFERAMEAIDLVAMATVADIVPLLDENRSIVKKGLERMNQRPRYAIEALSKVCGLHGKQIGSGNIGFGFGPRINAAGRLGDAKRALRLLLAEDRKNAMELAVELDEENQRRQQTEQEMLKQACQLLDEYVDSQRVAVVAKEGWHSGVAGIVASRLVELYQRPSAVICLENGVATGSARGIPGVNIFEALDACRDLMIKYGGHAQAGGFSLKQENLPAFMERYNEFFCTHYPLSTWVPTVDCDVLLTPEDVTVPLAESFSAMAPFGMGNPTPTALFENVRVISSAPLGKTGDHAKYVLEKDQHTAEMIAFRIAGKDMPIPNQRIDVSAVLELDEFRQVKRAKCLYKQHSIHVEGLEDLANTLDCQLIFDLAKALPSFSPRFQDYSAFYKAAHEHPFGTYVCCLTPIAANRLFKQIREDGLSAIIDLSVLHYPKNKHRMNALLVGGGAWRKELPVLDDTQEIKSTVSKMRLCREDLIRVYLQCKKMGSGAMQLRERCHRLSLSAGVEPYQAAAALAIFEDLAFLNFEQSTMWVDPHPQKSDLGESSIYTALQKGW